MSSIPSYCSITGTVPCSSLFLYLNSLYHQIPGTGMLCEIEIDTTSKDLVVAGNCITHFKIKHLKIHLISQPSQGGPLIVFFCCPGLPPGCMFLLLFFSNLSPRVLFHFILFSFLFFSTGLIFKFKKKVFPPSQAKGEKENSSAFSY